MQSSGPFGQTGSLIIPYQNDKNYSNRKNELYTPTAFAGGNAVRKVLEYSMGDQASADRDTVLERIAAGQSAEAATAEFLTDDYFEAWYQATLAQLQQYEG